MLPLVEWGNRHSARASALSFSACFLISDGVTSFCLRAMVLSNFQSRAPTNLDNGRARTNCACSRLRHSSQKIFKISCLALNIWNCLQTWARLFQTNDVVR